MEEVRNLLEHVIKLGVMELAKSPQRGVNVKISKRDEGIHCTLNDTDYLISIEKIETPNNLETLDPEFLVYNLLREVGVPANLKGYYYLREAIKLVYEDNSMLHYMTKVVYPYVAKQFDTTPTRVERAIRHAVDVSMIRGNINSIHDIFKGTFARGKDKPTNTEFIATLVEVIQHRK